MQHQYNEVYAWHQRDEPEDPLDKLGWYTDEGMPIHVSDCDIEEEKAYHDLVKQVKHEDWRLILTSLKEKIAYLCCNELFSDVFISLKQQDKHYPAHRFILALQSDYFQKSFYGPLKSNNSYCQVEKVSSGTMEKILSYIYGKNEVSINYGESGPSLKDFNELSEMMNFADMYWLSSLSSTCEQYALKILDNANVCHQYACQLFETAHMLNLYHLEEKCLELFSKNVELFLSSPHFVTLNKGIVKALYEFAVKINKREDFTPYLIRWCRNEVERNNRPDGDMKDLLLEFLQLTLSK